MSQSTNRVHAASVENAPKKPRKENHQPTYIDGRAAFNVVHVTDLMDLTDLLRGPRVAVWFDMM